MRNMTEEYIYLKEPGRYMSSMTTTTYPNEVVKSFWTNKNKFWHIVGQETGKEYIGFLNLTNLCCEIASLTCEEHEFCEISHEGVSKLLKFRPEIHIYDLETGGTCLMSRK